MYSYLNELNLYAGVLYMWPSWYSFSSWPYSFRSFSDWYFLGLAFFLLQRCFWDRFLFTHYIIIVYFSPKYQSRTTTTQFFIFVYSQWYIWTTDYIFIQVFKALNINKIEKLNNTSSRLTFSTTLWL